MFPRQLFYYLKTCFGTRIAGYFIVPRLYFSVIFTHLSQIFYIKLQQKKVNKMHYPLVLHIHFLRQLADGLYVFLYVNRYRNKIIKVVKCHFFISFIFLLQLRIILH